MSGNSMAHEIPSEFTDEDRWLRIFTNKSFAVLGITGMITLFLYKFFSLFSLNSIGLVMGGILVVTCTALTMIPVPGDNYLKGAGQKLDHILLLRMVRKRNRVIYVKGYGKGR